jgi:hypothetical protein
VFSQHGEPTELGLFGLFRQKGHMTSKNQMQQATAAMMIGIS